MTSFHPVMRRNIDIIIKILLVHLLIINIESFSSAFINQHATVKLSTKRSIAMLGEIQIEAAYNDDIPRVADFLGKYWYNVDISKSQRLEFVRLEKNDLIKRYGEQVGQRKYPAVMLMALEDQEILG